MDSATFTVTAGHFEADNHRRRLTQIELLITEMRLSIRNFDIDIKAEEQRTRISDPRHIAYSTLAMSAIQRRDNLKRTIAKLEEQLAALRQAGAPAPEHPNETTGNTTANGIEYAHESQM
jgi:flagellar FliJ protein